MRNYLIEDVLNEKKKHRNYVLNELAELRDTPGLTAVDVSIIDMLAAAMTYDEIADVLDVSKGTVANKVDRIRSLARGETVVKKLTPSKFIKRYTIEEIDKKCCLSFTERQILGAMKEKESLVKIAEMLGFPNHVYVYRMVEKIIRRFES
jgi:DNA-binding CsgD family transcriptional regulator